MQSLWMLFAAFFFAIMGVCVKFATAMYSTSEIIAYRGMISAAVILPLVVLQGGTLKTTLPWQHLWRGVVGATSLWLWFYAFNTLPLAMVMTLNYTAPIWIAAILMAIGWWRGTRNGEWALTAAIAVSFGGVVMLLQPAVHSEQWRSALMALGSGFISALAYLQVRKLGHMGEPEYRVVFYFSLTTIVAGLVSGLAGPAVFGASPLVWHAHTHDGLLLLLAIGVSATVAQVAMTRAYRLGKTMVTANLQYTGIIFASISGIVLWDDQLGWLGWSGIAVIIASGVAATFLGTQTQRAQTA